MFKNITVMNPAHYPDIRSLNPAYTPLSGRAVEELISLGGNIAYQRTYDGYHWLIAFPNGYGVSIVKADLYTGFIDGWELAVIRRNYTRPWNRNGEELDLTYSTPITDDVIVGMSEEEVLETCRRISSSAFIDECEAWLEQLEAEQADYDLYDEYEEDWD